MLELVNIKKSYRVGGQKQQVLKGINIKFRRNEFTSILGSSGSGKTTLLNIIGGLDKYSEGDLIIEGVSTNEYRDKDWDAYRNHRVGFIFQSYNLIMHQSILSNVEIALTLSGISRSERKKRAKEALIKVGLEEHIYKKPSQLSGGQMQRVAIARALVNDPEIILADEPTGALDSVTSIQIMDLLKEIAKDKLVIMVTHNPEIAKEYSTRIIELKDGIIVNDSNPYKKDKDEQNKKSMKKTSMSFLTSLSLSFNNLLTKKGRTILTSLAGSIGIIGIALILSLTNGVKKYATKLERDSLQDYPISIEKTSVDLFGGIAQLLNEAQTKKECPKGKICSNDDIVKATSITKDAGLVKKNDIGEFKKYLEEHKEIEKYALEISSDYKFDLQVYSKDYNKVNPSNILSTEKNVFKRIEDKTKEYKLLAGEMPKEKNELVFVINNNSINDSVLYALGIKDISNLYSDLSKTKSDTKYNVPVNEYTYDDLLNKEYKLILNTDYYKSEYGNFIDHSNDLDYMNNIIDNGLDIKITGIATDNSNDSYIGYMKDLELYVIDKISNTEIYKKQYDNKDVDVLTNKEFDGFTTTFENNQEKLAIYDIDDPSKLNIYPKDFKSKEKIEDYIEKYNTEKEKAGQNDKIISYSDVMKSIVGGVTNIINIISLVLIGFVAISLIVSSIMIGIITYISVLERTKEIGILRAIGASKKDIVRVFKAETVIEGLVAGVLGIVIALLISVPVNLVVSKVANIDNIATLPLTSALFLIALSVILNVIAGTIPSNMAARKDPVESLRSE